MEPAMKTNSRSNKDHFTPLKAMKTEAVCLGILWTLGAVSIVALLVFFGINEAREVFQPIVNALQGQPTIK